MKNKIGILCAGDSEVAPFIKMISNCEISQIAMLRFYEGQIDNINVVTLFSGVCKVNSAIAAQILIDKFECNVIINAGTAGAIDSKLEVFDTVISSKLAYHDVAEDLLTEFHPWLKSNYFKADEKLIELSKKAVGNNSRVYWGEMITGEVFVDEKNRKEITKKFKALSVDMESASVAHVCYVNRIPFISIRTITDTPNKSGVDEFEKNCDTASEISANIVKDILKLM